jgi:hypothetical protein
LLHITFTQNEHTTEKVLNCFVSSQVGRALVDALKKVQASATRHCAGPVRLLEQWTVNRERQAMNHLNREELSSIQHRQQQLKRKQGLESNFRAASYQTYPYAPVPFLFARFPLLGAGVQALLFLINLKHSQFTS